MLISFDFIVMAGSVFEGTLFDIDWLMDRVFVLDEVWEVIMFESFIFIVLVDRLDFIFVFIDKLEGICFIFEVCIMFVVVVVEIFEFWVLLFIILIVIGILVVGLGVRGDIILVVIMEGRFFICFVKVFMFEIFLKIDVKL